MTAPLPGDGDIAPAAICRTCTQPMLATHLICDLCRIDGHHPNADDTQARNARIAEILLWS